MLQRTYFCCMETNVLKKIVPPRSLGEGYRKCERCTKLYTGAPVYIGVPDKMFEVLFSDASIRDYCPACYSDEKKQALILRLIKERFSIDGWVTFTQLKNFDLEEEFFAYCQKHGCTLSTVEGRTVAPWADFRAFMLNKHPDD